MKQTIGREITSIVSEVTKAFFDTVEKGLKTEFNQEITT